MDASDVQARVVEDLNAASGTVTGRRSRRNDISREVRKKKAIERAAKNEAAWAALQVSIRTHKEDIARIAAQNGVSAKALRRKALQTTAIKPTRKTNLYNAFRRFKKIDLSRHRFGMTEEQQTFLLQLQALPTTVGYNSLLEASDDVKELIKFIHDQHRMNKHANARGSRRSIGQAFRRSCQRISDEIETLSTRCQTTAICIIVCSSTTGTHDPFVYTDSISKDFFENVKNLNINVLTEQYEGHAIQGTKAVVVSNSSSRRLDRKNELRQLVRSGLREITGKKNITMSWNNYDHAIVAKHHVRLVGWPSNFSFDIDGMSARDLQEIIDGIKNCKIKWEHTDDAAMGTSDHGEKKRKGRSDKGMKRGSYKKRQALTPITNTQDCQPGVDSSDLDSSSDSDQSSDESD